MMDPFFRWIEEGAVGTWVRESSSFLAFPGIISVHAIGLALVVGTCVAIDLRILGFMPKVPVAAMDRFVPVAWFGLVLNVVSGLLLLAAYPTKALTNPVFGVKMIGIVAGLSLLVAIRRNVLAVAAVGPSTGMIPGPARVLAISSLVAWAVTMTAGRLLAYTCTRLLVDFGSC